jgi:hypothetical protein
MSIHQRSISLAVIGAFALAALVYHLPVNASKRPVPLNPQKKRPTKATKPAKPQTGREALAKQPAPTGTLKDRLGDDDGYGLVIFYSTDIRGNLEVCGCAIHPLGGVARRLGYINAFRERSPDAATMMVDAGAIFIDAPNEAGTDLLPDARLMNEWVVRANEQMNLEVVNLSYRDLRYASGLLRPEAKLKPEKTAFISANIKSTDAARVNPAPYVIKTVTSKRLQKPVRIAFIGVSDAPPNSLKEAVTASGFTIEDPLEAVKKALAEVRDKADVTVVIGYLNFRRGTAKKIAQQNDDLDLIIVADENGGGETEEVNNALIMHASNQTQHLGELRFYTDASGVVDRFTIRYVDLDEVIPDDPKMGEITKQARAEIDVVQNQMAEAEAEAHAASDAAKAQASPYVTAETCGKCHKAEYETWQQSLHSHAFASLAPKHRTFDTACVVCHSIGFRDKLGFINIKATPQFANVQCEACHGPGAEHLKMPLGGNYKTPAAPASCVGCHDRENSPDFVLSKYWPVIAHTNSLKPPAPAKAKGKRPIKKR